MVLDTTIGGVSANSYLDVAAADAIAGQRIGPYHAKWRDSADAAEKDRALLTATRDVDEYIGPTTRWVATQALGFPRTIDLMLDGVTGRLLPEVTEATYEQAVYLFANAKDLANAATRRARAMYSFNEGDVGGSITLDPAFGRFSPDATRILESLPSEARGTIGSVPIRTILWLDSNGLAP